MNQAKRLGQNRKTTISKELILKEIYCLIGIIDSLAKVPDSNLSITVKKTGKWKMSRNFSTFLTLFSSVSFFSAISQHFLDLSHNFLNNFSELS